MGGIMGGGGEGGGGGGLFGTILGGIGAVAGGNIGAQQGIRRGEEFQSRAKLEAERTALSPLLGIAPGRIGQSPDIADDVLIGATSGSQIFSQFGGGGGEKKKEPGGGTGPDSALGIGLG
jgi:hypothetical protein